MIVAGSTFDVEEIALLHVFRKLQERYGYAVLVLAPRHPERFDGVAEMLASSGIPYQRRSRWDGESAIAPGVFLLDSIGELAGMYEVADLAFVGGSLVPRGGHNVVEAAQFGKAILVGPSTENFRDVIEVFRRADALRVVEAPQMLVQSFLDLLDNPGECEALGQRALGVVRSQQGATEKTVHELLHLLTPRLSPADVPSETRA